MKMYLAIIARYQDKAAKYYSASRYYRDEAPAVSIEYANEAAQYARAARAMVMELINK